MAKRKSKKSKKLPLWCSAVAFIVIAILAGLYFGYQPFANFVDTKILININKQKEEEPKTPQTPSNPTNGKLEDAGFASLNGNIAVTSKDTSVTVNCSNNNKVLMESDWFKEQVQLGYRTIPTDWINATAPTTPETLPNVDDEISFHFLELGNNYTGDSTYIKVKGDGGEDIDILIDAGSRQNSAPTIEAYVDTYCTDNTLEYVIATHAHQDHIAGFVSTTKTDGIFEYYTCETIIDYSKSGSTAKIREKYEDARDAEVQSGAKHYTALECINETDGAQKEYQLTSTIKMTILDSYFYDHETSDENDYSVCVMFTHGTRQFLFTGDLEAEGEEKLLECNSLGQVELFKGGHHGSPTSSTEGLLEVIQPKIVCVCCCAGSVEYTTNMQNTFPSQAFINRISKYTVLVYVTTYGKLEEEIQSTSLNNADIVLRQNYAIYP